MKRKIFYFVLLFSFNIAICCAEEPNISSIEPQFGFGGDEVTITGCGFKITDEKGDNVKHPCAYVTFFYEYKKPNQETVKIVEWRAGIEKWEDNIIIATVPLNAKQGRVSIKVHNGVKSTEEKTFWITSTGLVDSAIKLKQSGLSDSSLVDHLFHEGTRRLILNSEAKNVFGNTVLTAGEISDLKESGFQDDFIAKFEGHEQHLTIGVSAIRLTETADLVPASMLRIFLVPRSYFKKRRDYWKKKCKLYFPVGLFHYDRWDLNVGITTSTSTTENPEDPTSQDRSYVLLGASHELNRSALLNIGYAFAPGDTTGERTQFYIGFTLDSNFLKALGIIEK